MYSSLTTKVQNPHFTGLIKVLMEDPGFTFISRHLEIFFKEHASHEGQLETVINNLSDKISAVQNAITLDNWLGPWGTRICLRECK